MLNQHTYYQPNDYEQMLIAAGWVSLESLDKDYQKYAQEATRRLWGTDAEVLSYASWLSLKHEWDELNFQYDSMEKLPSTSSWRENRARASDLEQLLTRMSRIETELGY